MSDLTACPGCGAELPPIDSATHDYIGASAACWAIYGEVLAREYSDMGYMRVHPYTVDAYAVQHPGKPERRSIQSVIVHLITLYGTIELEYPAGKMAAIRQQATTLADQFYWLAPPDKMGVLTIVDVHAAPDAATHNTTVKHWAKQMWEVWQPHHAIIKKWAAQSGL
jgi:hypothetical protein